MIDEYARQILEKGDPFTSPNLWASPIKPILNRDKLLYLRKFLFPQEYWILGSLLTKISYIPSVS